jgi:hypothetical protein
MVAGLSAAWILDGLQITIASSVTGVLASPDALGMTSTEVGLSVSVYLRPSPDVRVWRQQALMQRNTAEVLRPLFEQAYLVLHDVALPGWLDSLDHLVVGPTGVWVAGPCSTGSCSLAAALRPPRSAACVARPTP